MRHLFLTILLITAVSCSSISIEPSSMVVVNGWIDEGNVPVVILSRSLSVGNGRFEKKDLEKNIITNATVSISDGIDTVYLVSGRNDDYFPPYIYTTGWMKGEAGRKYKIEVEADGRTITAETSIEQSIELESIYAEKSADNDTLYNIFAEFTNDPSKKSKFIFFVYNSKTDVSMGPSYTGVLNGEFLPSGKIKVSVFPNSDSATEEYFSFPHNSITTIKFCTLDEQTFSFWLSYFETTEFMHAMIIPIDRNLSSNINGGIGIWAGYGTRGEYGLLLLE